MSASAPDRSLGASQSVSSIQRLALTRVSFSLRNAERPLLTLVLSFLHLSFQLRVSSILRPRYLVLVTLPIISWLTPIPQVHSGYCGVLNDL